MSAYELYRISILFFIHMNCYCSFSSIVSRDKAKESKGIQI